jgi:hypothetical protein
MIEQIQTHQPSFIKRFLYRSKRPSREALVLKSKISVSLLLFLIALVLVTVISLHMHYGTYILISILLFQMYLCICIVRCPWNLFTSILSFQYARRSKILGIWMMNLMLNLIHLALMAGIITVIYKFRIYDSR